MKQSEGVPTWDELTAEEQLAIIPQSAIDHMTKQAAIMELYNRAENARLKCPSCNTEFKNNIMGGDHYPTRWCPNCKTVYDMKATSMKNCVDFVWYNKDKEVISTTRHSVLYNNWEE